MTEKLKNDKRFCIAGIGGVGGYLGGSLAKTYEHIYFFARGGRRDHIKAEGLTVKSDVQGTFTARPEAVSDQACDLGVMDYILIAVKRYALEGLCAQIKPMIGKDTVLIPVMNGVGVEAELHKYLPGVQVMEGLIYTISESLPDYSISQQGNFTNVYIGGHPMAAEVQRMFETAGVDCSVSQNITAAIWKKYILNCSYNMITAYYVDNIGGVRQRPEGLVQMRGLLDEACAVAAAMKIPVPEDLAEREYIRMKDKQDPEATSSLKRDVAAGKEGELDYFGGALITLGEACGVDVPVTRALYTALKGRGLAC